jgi:hypothetical protein
VDIPTTNEVYYDPKPKTTDEFVVRDGENLDKIFL